MAMPEMTISFSIAELHKTAPWRLKFNQRFRRQQWAAA